MPEQADHQNGRVFHRNLRPSEFIDRRHFRHPLSTAFRQNQRHQMAAAKIQEDLFW